MSMRRWRSSSGRTALLVIAMVAASCVGSGFDESRASAVVGRVGGTACNRTTEGSAVIAGEGLVLTNAHVVAGVGADLVFWTLDGSSFGAEIVGFDPERDLALLRVAGLGGGPVSLAEGKAGERALIAGVTTDLELDLIETEVLRPIIATGDDIYSTGDVSRAALEISADIRSGVSGAALFNESNQVIGIVFAESRNIDSSYAVSASEIEAFLAETDSATVVESGRCR